MESRILPIPQVCQKEHSFCLYACTSMVLKYFGINKSMGDVASEVFFPAPGDTELLAESAGAMAAYLDDYGLEAKIYIMQDWDAIRKRIELGHALIVGVKATPDDIKQDHAWVVRGFTTKDNIQKILFNNPWNDPKDANPVTYDADSDGMPGETLDYKKFYDLYWSGGLPSQERMFIDVCYDGQGLSSQYDLRSAATKLGQTFIYHTLRSWKAALKFQPFKSTIEALLAGLSFVGQIFGVVQSIGEIILSGGTALIDKGKKLTEKKGLGNKLLGGALIVVGAIVTAVGFIVEMVGAIVATVVSVVVSVVDMIGSVFDGSSSDSNNAAIGASNVDVGVWVDSNPWSSRFGKNWEDVSGAWGIAIRDQTIVDQIYVEWEMEIGGWGIDNWTLNRSLDQCNGDFQSEMERNSTNHFKRFSIRMTNTQGIMMSCSGRCKYGGDGAMTMVKMKVKAVVSHQGQEVTIEEDAIIIGFST